MNSYGNPVSRMPHGVCVKVASLRSGKQEYTDLRDWLSDPNNEYVGRHGRVFIGSKETKEIFHYPGSKWANPYPLKEYSLEDSLRLYREHLHKLLDDPANRAEFLELANRNSIGCFCDPGAPCHRDIIIETLTELLASEGPTVDRPPITRPTVRSPVVRAPVGRAPVARKAAAKSPVPTAKSPVPKSAVSNPDSEYWKMTVVELKAELGRRQLKKTGLKADLIQRLIESDE